MKLMLKTSLFAIALATAATAYAGTRAQIQVQVNTTARYAYGAMADARGSADGTQQISCYTNSTVGGCYLAAASGAGGSCYTTDPAMIELFRSISGESYVYIQWNPDSTCSYVLVQNASFMKPGAVSGY